MSTSSLRLPDSLHEEIKSFAQKEGISINQFISSAAAEKMSALLTEKYLAKRARKGDESAFMHTMEKIPDVEPDDFDKI